MSSVEINFTNCFDETVRRWPHLQDKRSYIQIRRGRQESFKIVLELFPNGNFMEFINLSLTIHTSCQLCLQVMSYIRTSLNLLFIFCQIIILARQNASLPASLFSTPMGLPSHTTCPYPLLADLFSIPTGQPLKPSQADPPFFKILV